MGHHITVTICPVVVQSVAGLTCVPSFYNSRYYTYCTDTRDRGEAQVSRAVGDLGIPTVAVSVLTVVVALVVAVVLYVGLIPIFSFALFFLIVTVP